MTSSHPASSQTTSSATLRQLQHEVEPSNTPQRPEGEPPVTHKDEIEAYRVDWSENDPENPRNWKPAYK
ncbi:MAG: hypothetical protein Q9218_007455, partial [Villophora microphyllina]